MCQSSFSQPRVRCRHMTYELWSHGNNQMVSDVRSKDLFDPYLTIHVNDSDPFPSRSCDQFWFRVHKQLMLSSARGLCCFTQLMHRMSNNIFFHSRLLVLVMQIVWVFRYLPLKCLSLHQQLFTNSHFQTDGIESIVDALFWGLCRGKLEIPEMDISKPWQQTSKPCAPLQNVNISSVPPKKI